jgi:hypothetical protein
MSFLSIDSLLRTRRVPPKSQCLHVTLSVSLALVVVMAFGIAFYVFEREETTLTTISNTDTGALHGTPCSPVGISTGSFTIPPSVNSALRLDGFMVPAAIQRGNWLRLLEYKVIFGFLPDLQVLTNSGSVGWQCDGQNLFLKTNPAELANVIHLPLTTNSYSALEYSVPGCSTANDTHPFAFNNDAGNWAVHNQVGALVNFFRESSSPYLCTSVEKKTLLEVLVLAFSAALTTYQVGHVVFAFITAKCNTDESDSQTHQDVALKDIGVTSSSSATHHHGSSY